MPISKHQNDIDEIYAKYQRTLEMLDEALDEIQSLKAALDQKPKEVLVEKEVEKIVEAEIDLQTPNRVAELEKKLEQKLANNDGSEN
jgi:hypothetical protein